MLYDDNPEEFNPIEGKGEEMVPEQGLPFEDIDDPMEGLAMELDEMNDEEARDLTPEELAQLLGGSHGTEDFIAQPLPPAEMSPDEDGGPEEDGGMGAGVEEPVILESEIEGEMPLVDDDVKLPPPTSITGAPSPSEMAEWDPSVTSAQHTASRIEGSQGLEASDAMKEIFITKERLLQLWDRIDVAQQQIREKVPSLSLARELYDQVEAARNDLLSGEDKYEESERALNEVEMRIAIVERAKKDGPVATVLFLYLMLWAAVFLTAVIGFGVMGWGANFESNTIAFIFTAVAGSFGGIVGALYALWKHVSMEVDFSRQYATWYVINPIMGFFLGMFVYGVMQTGYSSMFAEAGSLDPTSSWVLYILGFVVGYQQNVAWELMRRIIKMIFQLDTYSSEKKEEA